jgi:gamma-D-glutamyl-L-lysine dipeptidyl-peptidase
MEYGICMLAIVPLRAEGSERSEMVSQLLFGETYQITEVQEKWVKIITAHDQYEGWMSRVQVSVINYESYLQLQSAAQALTTAPVTTITRKSDNSLVNLPAGCLLLLTDGGAINMNQELFEVAITNIKLPSYAAIDLLTYAKSYLNSPYLWGGRTHFGIDCSGFVQAVFKQLGVQLKRDASQQVEQGTVVDFLPEARLGDLAFFDNDEGRIVHVGIMLSNEEIIHASGRVKIDRIDGQGIYSEELRKHTHKLRIVKRMI